MIHDKNEKFPGFPPEPKENFWQYPRCLNGYLHQLSGSEEKVLHYIVRHTWGYKKTADRISLKQFKYGIKNRKTGQWTDKGTGIKHTATLLKALKGLEEKGFVIVTKKSGKTTEYSLKVVQEVNTPYSRSEQVGSSNNEHTIKDVAINNSQKDCFYKKKRPFYRGDPMRWKEAEKQWYVIVKGEWLKYADKESKIEWK